MPNTVLRCVSPLVDGIATVGCLVNLFTKDKAVCPANIKMRVVKNLLASVLLFSSDSVNDSLHKASAMNREQKFNGTLKKS